MDRPSILPPHVLVHKRHMMVSRRSRLSYSASQSSNYPQHGRMQGTGTVSDCGVTIVWHTVLPSPSYSTDAFADLLTTASPASEGGRTGCDRGIRFTAAR